jgi:hypothetical protein
MFIYLTIYVFFPTYIYKTKQPFTHTWSYWCRYSFVHSFSGRFILLPLSPPPNYPQLMGHKQYFTHRVYCRCVYGLLCTVFHVTNSSASLTPTNRRATKNFSEPVGLYFTLHEYNKLPHLKLYVFRLLYYHKTFRTLCLCVCVCVCVCGART